MKRSRVKVCNRMDMYAYWREVRREGKKERKKMVMEELRAMPMRE